MCRGRLVKETDPLVLFGSAAATNGAPHHRRGEGLVNVGIEAPFLLLAGGDIDLQLLLGDVRRHHRRILTSRYPAGSVPVDSPLPAVRRGRHTYGRGRVGHVSVTG